MEKEQIFIQALKVMPNRFSSNEFTKKCKRFGLSDFYIRNGHCLTFLLQNCDRGDSKRIWIKRELSNTVLFYDKNELNEENAIKLLKSLKIYKILKQNIEFKEI